MRKKKIPPERFLDRPGDELVAVGKLTDPLGDFIRKSDGNLHTRPRGRLYLKQSPAASRPPGSFLRFLYGCQVSFRVPAPEVGTV
jgi:hypothetical protein